MTGAEVRGAREQLRVSLITLKDVFGITGSFVFTRAGDLVARDLPSMFDDTALGEASGRLMRLHETFAAAGDQLDVAVLRFRDHKLYVKTLPTGALCIVSGGAVNMPALRMAANLVGRRITPALEALANAPALPDEPEPPPVPAPAPRPAALAPPGMRIFRGRPLE